LPRLSARREDGTTECRFWQAGGGYDRDVVEERALLRMIDDIHLDPVLRGRNAGPCERLVHRGARRQVWATRITGLIRLI
jgi:hypothetical protein